MTHCLALRPRKCLSPDRPLQLGAHNGGGAYAARISCGLASFLVLPGMNVELARCFCDHPLPHPGGSERASTPTRGALSNSGVWQDVLTAKIAATMRSAGPSNLTGMSVPAAASNAGSRWVERLAQIGCFSVFPRHLGQCTLDPIGRAWSGDNQAQRRCR